MIDPEQWEFTDRHLHIFPENHPACSNLRAASLEKADAIIAAGWQPPPTPAHNAHRDESDATDDKALRNKIAGDIFDEEQQLADVMIKKRLDGMALDSHEHSRLIGIAVGLQRARDIVRQEGPPASMPQKERGEILDSIVRDEA